MAEKFKSIFRRKEFEKVYELGIKEWMQIGDYSCVFTKGCSFIDPNKVSSYSELTEISDKELGVYDVEMPLLEVGDEFFLHDVQELVKIKSRYRSSDGSITYYVEDKVVETENTQKSKETVEKQLENWNHEEERFEKLRKEFDDYKAKYKYENRFFNKRIDEKQS